MVPIEELHVHILTIHYEPPKRGQPLYKEQNAWSKLSFILGSTVIIIIQAMFLVLGYLI